MESQVAFHPAVRLWFERRFAEGPTPAQQRGWPEIAAGRDALIAAPTGSGKTLAAFLVGIDRLYREFDARAGLDDAARVLYVSPLKALGVDIQKNLAQPLREIADCARELGRAAPVIRSWVRSGDTPAAERAAMLRRPPHFLITTPESLYLLLTAERSREILRSVETVIVDEIHALARDKRGSHLALSLERLTALCARRPQRIGLSATQHPIDELARFLVGAGAPEGAAPDCRIVDSGHLRELDLALELPPSELEAVCSGEQWDEIVDRIAELSSAQRTTLVFTNTRRLAERLAHQLERRVGADRVAAHHGSLAKERRLAVEARLRAGELPLLVATASLELGIDIGPIDLVCQIGSPRWISTFLQRVGRSGHRRSALPKGRLFPTTRDELVECAALLRAVHAQRLDRIEIPQAPLDILAQQIVAECAARDWSAAQLFELVRSAAPFAALSRDTYDEVIDWLSEGVDTGNGKRGAFLHRDRLHGMLRGRRGARLAALSSGGAIPDNAEYRVVGEGDDTYIGSVDEDWAVESMQGDIFLLGNHPWQILRVERGVVRVRDAAGRSPTIPFWLGEAPARSAELSQEVAALRAGIAGALTQGPREAAIDALAAEPGLSRAAAEQLVRYQAAGLAALGGVPTQREIIVERFFDETGGMQLVLHAPFGGRINRALGLTLRKRLCRSFDFELQAAASDDCVLLSLGPQHSFPLETCTALLRRAGVREALEQAILRAPMFRTRWRWNLARSLAILRRRGGRKNPANLQRMQADDLMAAIFPGLAACQENQAGPIEIPEHPIVRQTLRDCEVEAMDLDGLEALLDAIGEGRVALRLCETTDASPFSHEILGGRPHTFLDDAPLEERRSRALTLRRGLAETERDFTRLAPEAIEQVRREARPAPRDAEELHDLLVQQVLRRPVADWCDDFDALVAQGRALRVATAEGAFWAALERRPALEALLAAPRFDPDRSPPPELAEALRCDAEKAACAALRGHLEGVGPVSAADLCAATGLSAAQVEQALARLEHEGFLLRGRFDPALPVGAGAQVCARRLLARIHATSQQRLRAEIEPVAARDLLRFLLRWQHVLPETRLEGRAGLLHSIEQLRGVEAPLAAWEADLFASRVAAYRPEWLDDLCLSGEVGWLRLRPRELDEDAAAASARGGLAPSRSTPIAFLPRADLDFALAAFRGAEDGSEPGPGAAFDLLGILRARGALFFAELVRLCGRIPLEVEQGLWELVARGRVTSDGFEAARNLSGGGAHRAAPRRRRTGSGRTAARAARSSRREGRWSLIEREATPPAADEVAEEVAGWLLQRWGIVFRDLLAREEIALPWRELQWALRRFEAQGRVRGGRFVAGFGGEQFALPGAVEALRRVRRLPLDGSALRIAATDPLNLAGILTPGPRVPARAGHWLRYCDGALVESGSAAGAGRAVAGPSGR